MKLYDKDGNQVSLHVHMKDNKIEGVFSSEAAALEYRKKKYEGQWPYVWTSDLKNYLDTDIE